MYQLRVAGMVVLLIGGIISRAQENLPDAPIPTLKAQQSLSWSSSQQSGADRTGKDAHADVSTAKLNEDQLNTEQHQRVLGIVPNFYTVYGSSAASLTTGQKFRLAWKSELDPENLGMLALNAAMEKPSQKKHAGMVAQRYPDRLAIDWAQDMGGLLLGKVLLSSAFHEDPRFFYRDTPSKWSRISYSVWADFTVRNDNGRTEPAYSAFASEVVSHASVNLFYKYDQRIPARTIVKEILMDRLSGIGDNLGQEFVFHRFTSKKHHIASADSTH